MGTPSFRRLRRRRTRREIDDAFARWRLRFYVWATSLVLLLATLQAIEVAVAYVEGRPARLLPLLDAVSDRIRGRS